MGFEALSSMKVNFSKCELLPINIDSQRALDLANVFGCTVKDFPLVYLGIPIHWRRLRLQDWQVIIDKYTKKLQSWKGRFLSYGGRLVIINSVLSALVYYMLAFHIIPSKVRKLIDKIRANFLWHNGNHRKIHLINWRMVCRPKDKGGTGIKDLEIMNKALFCKWIWQFKDCKKVHWWKDILVAKYANCLNRLKWSPFWKAFKSLEDIVHINSAYTVGSGNTIRFWKDKWLDNQALCVRFHSLYQICVNKELSVAEALRSNLTLIGFSRQLSPIQIDQFTALQHIVNPCILQPTMPDQIVWMLESQGIFSTKSTYDWLIDSGVYNSTDAVIWDIKIPLKINMFLWLLSKRRLLTKDMLLIRGWQGDSSCVFCSHLESADHLFVRCTFSQVIWRWICQFWQCSVPNSLYEIGAICQSDSNSDTQAKLICISAFFLSLWLHRNEICFNTSTISSPLQIMRSMGYLLSYWSELWSPRLKEAVLKWRPSVQQSQLMLADV